MSTIFMVLASIAFIATVYWIVDWIGNRSKPEVNETSIWIQEFINAQRTSLPSDLEVKEALKDVKAELKEIEQEVSKRQPEKKSPRLSKTQKIIVLTLLCLANAITISILLLMLFSQDNLVFLMIGITASIFDIFLAMVTLIFDYL